MLDEALRIGHETVAVSESTLSTLHQQRAQINSIQGGVDNMSDNLDHADKSLNKLNKKCIIF
jgi:predicted translin family RNA/ssDNA-binding protein